MTKATGFASPAQGYEEQGIDLNRLLILNPPATYFLRLESDDMDDFGLPFGSLLIVDRSRIPAPNSLVLIRHEGQFLCRLMCQAPSAAPSPAGTPENGAVYFTNGKEIIYPAAGETEIIGAITASIKIYGIPH